MTTATIAKNDGRASRIRSPENDTAAARRAKHLHLAPDAPPESARTTAPGSVPESAKMPPLHARVREMLRAAPPATMPREHRATLLLLAGFDGPKGICPGREAIEETFGISESTAKAELRDLETAQWIRVDRTRKKPDGRQACNGYQINLGGRWLPGGEEAPEPLPVVRLRDRRGTWEGVARGALKQPPQITGGIQGGAQATPSSRGARAHLSGGRAGAPDLDLDMQERSEPPIPPEPEPPALPPPAPRSGGPSGGPGQEQLFGAERGRAATAKGASTRKPPADSAPLREAFEELYQARTGKAPPRAQAADNKSARNMIDAAGGVEAAVKLFREAWALDDRDLPAGLRTLRWMGNNVQALELKLTAARRGATAQKPPPLADLGPSRVDDRPYQRPALPRPPPSFIRGALNSPGGAS